jgi:hypothetical protein
VHERVASSLEDEPVKKRLSSQLDDLGDRPRKRWPDAFLVHEETIEGTVQSVAAGGRAAMLATGSLVTDGVAWEDKLAAALLDDPKLPLILEATRQPRPPILPPPGNGHAIWDRIHNRAAGTSKADSGIDEAMEEEGVLIATLSVEPWNLAQTVERGTFRGWRWLGTMEQRWVESSDWRSSPRSDPSCGAAIGPARTPFRTRSTPPHSTAASTAGCGPPQPSVFGPRGRQYPATSCCLWLRSAFPPGRPSA